jgi:hypothetical protein
LRRWCSILLGLRNIAAAASRVVRPLPATARSGAPGASTGRAATRPACAQSPPSLRAQRARGSTTAPHQVAQNAAHSGLRDCARDRDQVCWSRPEPGPLARWELAHRSSGIFDSMPNRRTRATH